MYTDKTLQSKKEKKPGYTMPLWRLTINKEGLKEKKIANNTMLEQRTCVTPSINRFIIF